MKGFGCILLGLTFISSIAFGSAIPVRPTPGRGPAAKTLVVYSQAHESYSLLNSLELLRLQLGRFACTIEAVPVFEVTPEQLGKCDYLVILSLDAREVLPTNTIAAIASAQCPVLWLGLGLEPIRQIDLLRGQIEIGGESQVFTSHFVNYRGKRWNVGEFRFREIKLPAGSTAQVDLSEEPAEAVSSNQPIACKYRNFTFFTAEPQDGALGFIFEDLLFDFFGVQEVPAKACLLRISNYRPDSNHREFKRMADFLHSHSVPMAVSISGFNTAAKDSENNEEFFSSLRYAQQRGARVIIRGTDDFEFWDNEGDCPQMRITGGGIQARIIATTETALRNGLLPIAWETPQNAASSYCYGQIAGVFGTAVEQAQLSDATSRDNYAPAGLAVDRYGRLLVPENLAFVAGTNALVELQTRADLLATLRGSILGVSFEAYHSLSDLVQLVDLLESYHLPFLDLADLGNRVSLPGRVLLTGDASASVSLHNATVRWKTFSRSGQLLAEDVQRTKSNGDRQFKRIGIGTYELVQFTNDNGSGR